MKPSTKARLIPVLKTISTILEKCGGRGGTPGRCPGNNQSVATSDRSEKARQSSKGALDRSISLSGKFSMNARKAHDHAEIAAQHSSKASSSMLSVAKKSHHLQAARAHVVAAAHHSAAMEDHFRVAKYHMLDGNKKLAKQHIAAAELHRKAAISHDKAGQDHEKMRNKLIFKP